MEQTQNRRKGALVALAALLVCALSVFGTIAYLQTNTQKVHNTFTAGGISGIIQLLESPVVLSGQDYAKRGTPVAAAGQTYNVLPGTKIDKDTFVQVTDLNDKVWVYAAVSPTNLGLQSSIQQADGTVETLTDYALNSTEWEALKDDQGQQVFVEVVGNTGTVEAPEKWPVYYHLNEVGPTVVDGVDTAWKSNLLANTTITVADYADETKWAATDLDGVEKLHLDFQAFMVQTTSDEGVDFTPYQAWAFVGGNWDPVTP